MVDAKNLLRPHGDHQRTNPRRPDPRRQSARSSPPWSATSRAWSGSSRGPVQPRPATCEPLSACNVDSTPRNSRSSPKQIASERTRPAGMPPRVPGWPGPPRRAGRQQVPRSPWPMRSRRSCPRRRPRWPRARSPRRVPASSPARWPSCPRRSPPRTGPRSRRLWCARPSSCHRGNCARQPRAPSRPLRTSPMRRPRNTRRTCWPSRSGAPTPRRRSPCTTTVMARRPGASACRPGWLTSSARSCSR